MHPTGRSSTSDRTSTHHPVHPGRRCLTIVAAGLALALCATTRGETNSAAETSVELPQGTIVSRTLWLEAPEEACVAYYENFRERQWIIERTSPTVFRQILTAEGFPALVREVLLQPSFWQQVAPEVYLVNPPPDLLARLSPEERAKLYRIVAQWTGNQPERWPLVFADDAAFQRLLDQGIPADLVARVRALSYPFPGGFAFSDFSVLAHEFPDRSALIRFLQSASAVRSVIPRLRISNATRLSDVLSYWTVQRQNAYAAPLLEAMFEAKLPDGIDLISLLPGSPRVLSYNLDPAEVPQNPSLNTFLVSTSLSFPPQPIADIETLLGWLEDSFAPTQAPLRYGDLLVLQYPRGEIVPYACAYAVNDLVFARDPTGLGLWRFMTTSEILRRNPHFQNATFQPLRRISAP